MKLHILALAASVFVAIPALASEFKSGAELLRACAAMPEPVCRSSGGKALSIEEVECLWGLTTPLTPDERARVEACVAEIKEALKDWPVVMMTTNRYSAGLANHACPLDDIYPATAVASTFNSYWLDVGVERLPNMTSESAVLEAFSARFPYCASAKAS